MELNQVYCMDNLELLKQLPDESIDMIYCDILFNTGKKFKDYDDNLGTPQQAIEWYKPRLKEMKRVLSNKGSIYLQCDYRLVHYLKVEMDSIFGGNNDFTMSFKKNPCAGGVSKDSLNNYLGVNLPEFTIVNFISPDETTLQFKEPISKETYKALEKNEWCEHKFNDDGTSICWIWKTEPGEYSTHITLDGQHAYLSKSANER